MNKSASLKSIERAAYRSTFEDGIYDIAIGLAFLILALVPALNSAGAASSYWYLLLVIPAFLPWPAKRLVTIPRLGAVSFSPKRQTRRRLFLLIAATFLFLTMPVILLMYTARSHESAMAAIGLPFIVSLIVPFVMILAAYLLDYVRLYIYAAALLVAVPYAAVLGRMIGLSIGLAAGFGVPGAAILLYGLMLLSLFIKKYPKSVGEDYHDAQ